MEAAQTATEAVAEGGEVPSQSSAVLDEIEKLQNKRSGWGAGLILLMVSVGLFLALGAAHWSLEFAAMLLPILFFHELGHFAAMRLFRYSNVKMFFIPLLGAAVSGRHYNVPGWKKVIVSLAGPLPGIFLATGLGCCAVYYRIDWLQHAAMLTIFLNGFNLLPILPLDGGWVVHALLFSRHYILDAGFRVLAVVILIAGSFLIGDYFLFFFGVVMAAGLPVAFRMAGVVSAVRRQGISTASPDNQSIPPETAQTIADEIRSRFPQALTNKNVAQFTLQAFEALNARPPGLIATILLGGVYLGSFLFALVAVAVLTVGLPMFMEPDFTPIHPIEVGQIEIAGRDRGVDVPAGEVTIVATFADADAAAARFAEFKEQMTDDTTLLQFGKSLLVAVPPDGQLTPDQWESRLASQTLVVFNPADSLTIGFSVAATAPSEEVAAQIQDALKTYQLCSVWIAPNPPWHPDDAPTAEQQQARELFVKLTETEDVYDDPRHERFNGQLTEAYENGDEDRLGKLREEMDAVRKAIREDRLDKIREEAIDPREQELISLYRRQPVFDPEPDVPIQSDEPVPEPVREAREKASREYRERLNVWQGELAELLGGMRREPDRMVSKADRFTLEGGTIERNGRMLRIEYAELFWPADAAPAFIRWLDEQGCTEMKYSFLGD
jgi:Zn-dependent protease